MLAEMPVLGYRSFVLIHVMMIVEGMLMMSRLRSDLKEMVRIQLKSAHVLFVGQVALLTIVAII